MRPPPRPASPFSTTKSERPDACYHVIYYTEMDEVLSTEYPGARLVG
ncbi:MAG: hypothetical protein ACRDN0_08190 [Trebonia sp.]